MKVIKLHEFGEERFIHVLYELSTTSSDRNKDWFPVLLKNYQKYKEWYFVVTNDNKLVAFSTIQEFYHKCYRVLTRCYVFPDYRRPVLLKDDTNKSPASLMIVHQLNDITNFDTAFISLENISRSRAIYRMANKMHNTTGLEWNVVPGMMQTCSNNNSKSCWQNICYTGVIPTLPIIDYAEWKTKQ